MTTLAPQQTVSSSTQRHSPPAAVPLATRVIIDPGDHVFVDRGVFSHHGIARADGTVIHFSKSGGMILSSTIGEFANGDHVKVRPYGTRFSADDTVRRAESLIGQSGYDLFKNNCEHFATWCVTGEHSSAQVEAAASVGGAVVVSGVAPSLGVAIVASAGETAALSGVNLMSGLAAVGGTAIGGIAALGATTGALSAGTMCLALRDKPTLPNHERQARRIGRYGAVGGAAAGVGVAVYAVGAMGVAGYSAVGITTGLAALGGVTGGRMARGVMTTLFIPALCAVVVCCLVYFIATRVLGPQRPPAVRPEHAA